MKTPQPLEISEDARVIKGNANALQALRKAIAATVPEVWTTLDDNGAQQLHWPEAADVPVRQYLALYRGLTDNPFLYEGAFATGVRRAKLLSVATLAMAVAGGPGLLLTSTTAWQSFLGMAMTSVGAAVTATLHAVTTPYVLSLRRLADGSFLAETPLMSGAVKETHFNKQEVMISNTPFCTFTAKGQRFYVHRELFVGDDAQTMLCDLLGEEAAEQMYAAQLQANPGDLDALYNQGRFLWKVRGDLAGAESAFARVIAEDPSDREVLKALGEVRALRAKASPAAAA